MSRSLRFTATPRPFVNVSLPEYFSFQCRTPRSHSASACIADVLPELFGPTKTTGLPSSISTSLSRLKLRTVSLVSIFGRSFRVGDLYGVGNCSARGTRFFIVDSRSNSKCRGDFGDTLISSEDFVLNNAPLARILRSHRRDESGGRSTRDTENQRRALNVHSDPSEEQFSRTPDSRVAQATGWDDSSGDRNCYGELVPRIGMARGKLV